MGDVGTENGNSGELFISPRTVDDDDIELDFFLLLSFCVDSNIVDLILASVLSRSSCSSDDVDDVDFVCVTQPFLYELNSLLSSLLILTKLLSSVFGLFKFNKLLFSFSTILSLNCLFVLFITFPVLSLDSDKLGGDGLESYLARGAFIFVSFLRFLVYVGESRKLSI